jgi:flagellar hook-associated protein 2
VPATGTTAVAKYTTFNASLADTSIASASASTGAVAGSYSLEVSSLAQSQRLVTPAYVAGSASTVITTGDLLIEFGKLSGGIYTSDSLRSKTITIDSTNATLGGLRDAINAANIGASATIVTGTNGAQLVLSSDATGLSNVMRLSGTGTTPLTGFDYNPVTDSGTLTQDPLQGGQAALNAAFKLNGIAATSSTNSVTGVLDGVTLNLLKTTALLTPTTLKISKDSVASLTSSLNAFIKAYNDANKAMTDLGAYNATTKSAGALQGNSTLRTAKNQISSLVFGATAGGSAAYQHLSDIGVSLAKDGTLSLDSAKLSTAIAADPTAIANLVSTVGSAYKTAIDGLVGSTGSITSATDSANRSIKDLTQRQQTLSDRLAVIQANYTKQFTALDSMIASMKQTSTYLTQQLANLPGVVSSTK